MDKVVLLICFILLLAAFIIPQVHRSYYSAPYFYFSDKQIVLESEKTHRLNPYQKKQFIKIAKTAIDQKDGPFDWDNYQTISINVYKMKGLHEYALIYRIKPHIRSDNHIITNSIILDLKYRSLDKYKHFTIKKYSSDFSNLFVSGD